MIRSHLFVVAVLLELLASLAMPSLRIAEANGQTTVTCDFYASSAGNDANPGSIDAPVLSIRRLADLLAPGQTGCLSAGDEFVSPGDGSGSIQNSGEEGQPITLRSGPGGRATMRGQFEVTGSNVVVRDLAFHGYVPTTTVPNFKGKMLNVLGDNVHVLNSDITSDYGICVGAGSAPNNVRADNFVFDGNRIYECGRLNTFVPADSGSHGAYIEHTLNASITNNYFYDNRVRGLQLYPKASYTYVANNVLNGNSGNLNIGGEHGIYPDTSLVENNIIANSTFTGNNKDSHEVFGYYPNNGQTYGNVVRDNCVFNTQHPDRLFGGYGYVGDATTNIVADPLYVDPANKNFALRPNSPCLGKGPMSTMGDGSVGESNEPETEDGLTVTIVNVDETGQPLLHSCFQIFAATAELSTDAPLLDQCDSEQGAADGAVTFELAPATYILHQSWIDAEGYAVMEPGSIIVTSDSSQVLEVQNLPVVVSSIELTIVNVDDAGQPLLHSCFHIYAETADLDADVPLVDECDAQMGAPDGQMTVDLLPGTYIVHQSWVDREGYAAMEPQQVVVTNDPVQQLTLQNHRETDSGSNAYPPGWYDAQGDGCLYWYDGRQYTGHVDCNGDEIAD